jgi:hypothetical protein
MHKTLEAKLDLLHRNPCADCFILADAKDADMAFGIASTGVNLDGSRRSIAGYRDQIRAVVRQGLVDITLMSASTSELLTIRERLFDGSAVTPAARANDTTDVHLPRGGRYVQAPSRPFSSATIDHIQHGRLDVEPGTPVRGADLGLYSVTFNNNPERDLETMRAFRAFHGEAERKGFQYFLEVFPPNVPPAEHGLAPAEIPGFVNDHIVRLLAGVPSPGRPQFLKIPYFGAAALEELCAYDPSMVVGVLGGSAGTSFDAFNLLASARKHGARVALYGRKINAAEDQLLFVEHLRRVADGALAPADAVKSYHAGLAARGIKPRRLLDEDLAETETRAAYGG